MAFLLDTLLAPCEICGGWASFCPCTKTLSLTLSLLSNVLHLRRCGGLLLLLLLLLQPVEAGVVDQQLGVDPAGHAVEATHEPRQRPQAPAEAPGVAEVPLDPGAARIQRPRQGAGPAASPDAVGVALQLADAPQTAEGGPGRGGGGPAPCAASSAGPAAASRARGRGQRGRWSRTASRLAHTPPRQSDPPPWAAAAGPCPLRPRSSPPASSPAPASRW